MADSLQTIGLADGFGTGTYSVARSQGTEKGTFSFSDTMRQMSPQSGSTQSMASMQKKDNSDAYKKDFHNDRSSVSSREENRGNPEKVKNSLDDTGKKMVRAVSEETGATEEDVEKAMEILGLTATDLFDPQNLMKLIGEIGGGDEAVDVLTSEDLSQAFRNLSQMAQELVQDTSEKLGISEEEFKGALQNLNQMNGNQTVKVQDLVEDVQSDVPTIDTDDELPQIEVNIQSVSDANDSEDASAEQGSADGKQDSSLEKGLNTKELFDQISDRLNSTQTTQQNTNFIDAMGEAEQVADTSETQPSSILRQITDYMRVNVKEDMTSMEMQLHPASLGNIRVVVSTGRDGGTVATFTAQNETVKEALQTQMIQLQERFEEQGIKVNAIEVTVDTHAFEQNLEQGQQNPSEQEQQMRRPGNRRRINLDELLASDELQEPLTEEDRITAEMMAANGNTVDYMA